MLRGVPAGAGGDGVENGENTLLADLRQSEERFKLLSEASSLLLSSADPESTIQNIAENVMRHLGADVFFNYVLDPSADRLRLNACGGVSTRIAKMIERLELGQAICGCVARDGERIISEDVQNNGDPRADLVRRMGVTCYCCHPLKAGEATVGTLSFGTKSKTTFDEDEIEFMRTVANQVSIAMRRVRSEEGARRELAKTRVLQAAAEAATRPSLEDAASNVLDAVTEHMHMRMGIVYTYDRQSRDLELLAHRGMPSDYADRCRRLPMGADSPALVSRAAATKRMVASSEVALTQEREELLKAGGIQGSQNIAIPIVLQDQLAGVLSFVFDRELDFTPDERELFASLARILGQAFENARLFEAEHRAREAEAQRAEQMSLLRDMADIGASAIERRRAAALQLDLLRRRLALQGAYVFTLDAEGEHLELLAGAGLSLDVFEQYGPLSLNDDATLARVYRAKEPLVIRDVAAEGVSPRVKEVLNALGTRSVAIFPLIAKNEAIGTLAVASDQPNAFSEDDIELLTSVATEMALGLLNAQLFEAQALRRRRIEALHGVMEAAVSSLELHEAAQAILEYLAREHGFELANTWLAKESSLELIASVGYPETYRERFSPMPLTAPYDAIKVFETGTPIAVPNTEDANPAVREMYSSIGVSLGAYVIVPLASRGKTIGTLNFGWHKSRPINRYDIDFYHSIGDEVAVVLENAELYSLRSAQAEYAEALNRINAAVHSSLDFDEIMERVVVEIARVMEVDASALHMHVDDHWEFSHTYNVPEELQRMQFSNDEAMLSMLAVTTRSAVVVNDSLHDERANLPLMERFGITALVGVPLVIRGQAVGVLLALCLSGVMTFSKEQVDFLTKAAATLALALENARLYQTEHDIADKLQEALLAMPNEVNGIEFAHAYYSATEAARVGGDFYDLFEVDRERIGIVVGDVAGKGIDAAVMTSMVKNTIRAHANEEGKTPRQILELTNEVMHKATQRGSFVTVFFGILDCSDGRLVYANAGHTTAAIARGDGSIGRLPVTGPILGGFEDVSYQNGEASLDPGELLFLYTDGLTEARRNGELFGEERVFGYLPSVWDEEPRDVVSMMIEEVLVFSGGLLRDDLALLALKRTEAGTETPRQQKLEM